MTSPFRRPATAARSSAEASTRPFSPPVTASDADGVFVPRELCRPTARALTIWARKEVERNGGARIVPEVLALISALDSAAMSASGRPFATMDTHCWLAVGEAARRAGISARHARRLAKDGRLIARKDGRDWLIDSRSADEYHRRERARGTADGHSRGPRANEG